MIIIFFFLIYKVTLNSDAFIFENLARLVSAALNISISAIFNSVNSEEELKL